MFAVSAAYGGVTYMANFDDANLTKDRWAIAIMITMFISSTTINIKW